MVKYLKIIFAGEIDFGRIWLQREYILYLFMNTILMFASLVLNDSMLLYYVLAVKTYIDKLSNIDICLKYGSAVA